MGRSLFPSVQTKNLIAALIERDVLRGELVEVWMEKTQAEQKKQLLLKKAADGDTTSMVIVAQGFKTGRYGFEVNKQKAFHWYEKAHNGGSPFGTAGLGEMLCQGYGCQQDISKGMVYISLAAGQGSDHASYILGWAFANGVYGMPKDNSEAAKWLTKCLDGNCPFQNLTAKGKETAQKLLDRTSLNNHA